MHLSISVWFHTQYTHTHNTADTALTPPQGEDIVTIVLHIHGGGWVSQSPETHLCYLQPWAATSGLPILSVAYKLSPGSQYPNAINECFAVYQWLLNYNNLEKLGISANGMCVQCLARSLCLCVYGIDNSALHREHHHPHHCNR
jgi:acetyl esterase/lipase